MVRLFLASTLLLFSFAQTAVKDASEYQCLDDEARLRSTLHVDVAAGNHGFKPFSVPPMPADPQAYRYASDHAFLALPARCVAALGLAPNVGDSNQVINQWLGRKEDLHVETSGMTKEDVDAALTSCTCGWALFLHGSGGFSWDDMRYAIMMAALGYGVLAPDSFASPELGLRYNPAVKGLASRLRRLNSNASSLSFWCGELAYSGGCVAAVEDSGKAHMPSYPLCYNSNARNIVSHTSDWREYYERVFLLRKLELDYVVDNLPKYIANAPKVFLAGDSEGAMSAGRYYHERLERLLESGGRMLFAWSCQWCYYVSCPANARVGAGKAKRSTPVLSMISPTDPYFGPQDGSIAHFVANANGGYGETGAAETGNCFNQLASHDFEHAYVVVDLDAPGHGLVDPSSNLVRAAMATFMSGGHLGKVLDRLHVAPGGKKACSNTRRSMPYGGTLYAECRELVGPDAPTHEKKPEECPAPREFKQYYMPVEVEQCTSSTGFAGHQGAHSSPILP